MGSPRAVEFVCLSGLSASLNLLYGGVSYQHDSSSYVSLDLGHCVSLEPLLKPLVEALEILQ